MTFSCFAKRGFVPFLMQLWLHIFVIIYLRLGGVRNSKTFDEHPMEVFEKYFLILFSSLSSPFLRSQVLEISHQNDGHRSSFSVIFMIGIYSAKNARLMFISPYAFQIKSWLQKS